MEENRVSPYPVRMDSELRESLQALADKNGRSLNKEILAILEEASGRPPIVESVDARLTNLEKLTEEILSIVRK